MFQDSGTHFRLPSVNRFLSRNPGIRFFGQKSSFFVPHLCQPRYETRPLGAPSGTKSLDFCPRRAITVPRCRSSFVDPVLDGARQIKAEQHIGRDKTPPSFDLAQMGEIGQNSARRQSSSCQRSIQKQAPTIIENQAEKSSTLFSHAVALQPHTWRRWNRYISQPRGLTRTRFHPQILVRRRFYHCSI